MKNLGNKVGSIINKFDKDSDKKEIFSAHIETLSNKLMSLLDDPAISSHDFGGLRDQIAYLLNMVNNDLPSKSELLGTVSQKAMNIGNGYNLSDPKFEQFRRALASIQNFVNQKMQ